MEKIKKVIKKEEEIVAVQITLEEFVELASKECTRMFMELSSTGEPDIDDIFLPMICSDFAGQLAARIFGDDKDEESEDKE